MKFGEYVVYVRQKLRLTQSQLSKETGIPESTLIKWENDFNRKPQASNYGIFMDYCESKGIDVNYLKIDSNIQK